MHDDREGASQDDDPTARLLRRAALVFVIGGFFVFMVPRAVVGFLSGDFDRQLGSALALAFWAWLAWRIVVMIRASGAGQDPRYSFVSASGYGTFLMIYVAIGVWRAVRGDSDAGLLPFMMILFASALVSVLAGRRMATTRTPSAEDEEV